jgi:hypothetical protein
MKRFFFVFLFALTALFFTACSSSDDDDNGSSGGGGDTSYTVDFYENDILLTQQTVKSGESVELPTLYSACSPFEGWQLNGFGAVFNGQYTVRSNLRFDAKFKEPVLSVSSPQELYNIRNGLSGNYKLTEDISLSDYSTAPGWIPIGDDADPFEGCLDGNGFKITDLFVDTITGDAGLFGHVVGSEISNIGVVTDSRGVKCHDSDVVHDGHAGIIAGSATNSSITDSYATGTVSAVSPDIYTSITDNTYAGGLVGQMLKSSITNSYALADVTANGYDSSMAGGLVGWSNGNITNSYAGGSVTSSIGYYSYAGGLVGESYGSITNSYTSAAVTSDSDHLYAAAGGLVGVNRGSLTNSVAANPSVTITQGGTKYIGRVVAVAISGSISNNFAFSLMSVSNENDSVGSAGVDRDMNALQDPATYEGEIDGDGLGGLGWKFGGDGDNPWKMPSSAGYPILYWQ